MSARPTTSSSPIVARESLRGLPHRAARDKQLETALVAAAVELLRRRGALNAATIAVEDDDAQFLISVPFEGARLWRQLEARVRSAVGTPTADTAGSSQATLGIWRASRRPELRADVPFWIHLVRGTKAQLQIVATRGGAGPADLRRTARQLVALLAECLRTPSASADALDLCTPAERKRALAAGRGPALAAARHGSVTAAFRDAATRWGDRIAVEDGSERLTYRQLAASAARFRASLDAAKVRRGSRVGILGPRSAQHAACALGILDAGCAYVPLDASLPAVRLKAMCRAAGVRTVFALEEDSAEARALLGRAVRVLRPALNETGRRARVIAPAATAAAYVVFTSGSTGTPKPVAVPHRAVLRLARDPLCLKVGPRDKVLGVAAPTFDVAVLETWSALLNGACLSLAPAGPLSIAELAAVLRSRGITVAALSATLFAELARGAPDAFGGLRQLHVGGDVMPAQEARAVARRYPRLRLVNSYGPTECGVVVAAHEVSATGTGPIPIGRPVSGVHAHACDARGRLVPDGMVGELCVGGDGLAIGYDGDRALTRARFVVRSLGGRRLRLYRTGDLVRRGPSGALEFLGRSDGQVKLRGHRIELAEVDAALAAIPGVASAAAALAGSGAASALVAAVVPKPGRRAAFAEASVVETLRRSMPAIMVPSSIVVVERLPLTRHGKVDRGAIAALTAARTGPTSSAAVSASVVTRQLAAVCAEVLGVPAVDPEVSFFEQGGNSLLALRFVEALRQQLGLDLPLLRVFEFPRLSRLAASLSQAPASAAPPPRPTAQHASAVAVVGMAGRFPGADSPTALWELLRAGREGLRRFAPEELDPGLENPEDPHYVPVRGVLDGVEDFDAAFFGLSPQAARRMDPQQRLLLEAAWQAFEDAAIPPGDASAEQRTTGVFVGVSRNTYDAQRQRATGRVPSAADEAADAFVNDKDYAAAHIAHRLDLRGPAVGVQTSSSTSLTALAMAVQALRSGACDRALVGGASVTVPWRRGHRYEEGGIFSRDGHTRTFDADATGTTFGDGVAVLLLERLEDALRANRRVLGVIRGVGLSNDGAERASFSAPTVSGQQACIRRAYADAGWSPESVSYVEAHGTATPIGDPIEVEALIRAFGEHTERKRYCWLGSLKSNLGHLTAAAGAAGLIKVLLAMQHRWIPATLHVERPNPRIPFSDSPFLLPREGVAWRADGGPLRAGVSSFGVGGTNVHVLVEEPPSAADAPSSVADTPQLLRVSARSAASLRENVEALADELESRDVDLARVAATLRDGRRPHPRRVGVVASGRDEAVRALRAAARSISTEAPAAATSSVFLLPGQGSQVPGVGGVLFDAFPVFRDSVLRCERAAGRIRGRRLRYWMFGDGTRGPAKAPDLLATEVAQPALFALELALGRLLLSAGLRPDLLVGHSLGELTAATLAGVMTTEDGMRAVVQRGALMANMQPGVMLSVRADADAITPLLGADLSISAYNAPGLCAVGGPEHAISEFASAMAARGVRCTPLATSHAFHTRVMAPAAERFAAWMRTIPLRAPEMAFTSCVTGRVILDAEATSPDYWGAQILQAVQFASAVETAVAQGPVVAIEVGPRSTLSTLAALVDADRVMAAPLLPAAQAGEERAELLRGLGAAWTHGLDQLRWQEVEPLPVGGAVSLPGYRFERRRCWDLPNSVGSAAAPAGSAGERAATGGLPELLQRQRALIDQQAVLLRALVESADAGASQ
ncbi:MAG: amino acid adenylation domain-containing protein [Gemmatimonadaceae bacterium]|nr:amino acid adenylation domain-containing protein [Gemmatimonadaceae bacterium]